MSKTQICYRVLVIVTAVIVFLEILIVGIPARGVSILNNVAVHGKVNSGRNYAVLSAAIDNNWTANSKNYTFYLPLTTLAWKRIGYDSVILAVGSSNKPFSDPSIRQVLSKCLELDAVVIEIISPAENLVTISQVGRIYAANILSAVFPFVGSVYLITSDADLWPFNSSIYQLPADMEMLSLNFDCCGSFPHRDLHYRMLPMANIGMRVMTWNEVTKTQENIRPKSSKEILNFLSKEFDQVSLRNVIKGGNDGWYLDQHAISVMIQNWTKLHGSEHVKFVSRATRSDRIDRIRWKLPSSLDSMIDAHMPLPIKYSDVQKKILPMLKLMYGNNSEQYNWAVEYLEGYNNHSQLYAL